MCIFFILSLSYAHTHTPLKEHISVNVSSLGVCFTVDNDNVNSNIISVEMFTWIWFSRAVFFSSTSSFDVYCVSQLLLLLRIVSGYLFAMVLNIVACSTVNWLSIQLEPKKKKTKNCVYFLDFVTNFSLTLVRTDLNISKVSGKKWNNIACVCVIFLLSSTIRQ